MYTAVLLNAKLSAAPTPMQNIVEISVQTLWISEYLKQDTKIILQLMTASFSWESD